LSSFQEKIIIIIIYISSKVISLISTPKHFNFPFIEKKSHYLLIQINLAIREFIFCLQSHEILPMNGGIKESCILKLKFATSRTDKNGKEMINYIWNLWSFV
jgi:hypothetical protein